MGYNPDLLDFVVDWSGRFGIKPGAAVLDIGTQELFCENDPASLNRFLTHFGATPYEGEELAKMANRAFAAPLFQRARLKYRAVDITPYPHTLKLDLNTGSLPFWHRRRYALVVNAGTTEHVLNQLNVFRLIHDACAVGGLMYHGVPIAGDFWHGFVAYRPKLFSRLHEANDYEIIDRWIWAADERRSYEEIDDASFSAPFAAQDAWLHILLRRKTLAPFKAPSDCVGWPPV